MISIKPNLKSIVDPDGAVILDGALNQITTLDAMGAHIWQLLERYTPMEDIIRYLIQETGELPDTVRRDVRELINDLISRHLIVAEPTMVSSKEPQ
jgi:hypothetical protein